MKTGKDTGSYTRKATGEDITFTVEFPILSDSDLVVEMSDEAKKLFDSKKLTPFEIVNQVLKEDAFNNSRGRAKAENGDAEHAILTPEEKARRNADRKADREIIASLKSSGLTLAELLVKAGIR